MLELSESAFLRKGRCHHKHERAKNPSLPALIPGSGRVSVTGHVEFLAVDGSIISYRVWPEIVARFARVPTMSPAAVKAAVVGAKAKHYVDALLDLACDIERMGAAESKSSHNVINIAAQ
jgi:hypothetical protein